VTALPRRPRGAGHRSIARLSRCLGDRGPETGAGPRSLGERGEGRGKRAGGWDVHLDALDRFGSWIARSGATYGAGSGPWEGQATHGKPVVSRGLRSPG
jgi:hypothetical protein